jgi:hypothetical protein
MNMNAEFDDLRPYTDAEIPAAMKRIAESNHLPTIAKFLFPEKRLNEVQERLRSYTSIRDFQLDAMYAFNYQVIKQTSGTFTYDGMKHLDPAKNYLFVSNHRDIVMDASLLQYALHIEGFRTTEITFGSNLMHSQLVIDIGRSNKMFKVVRGGNAREFYKNSLYLSEYIRYAITEKGESVWIAQRNGRTKDGNDATDHGIIKMFCMSGGKDIAQSLSELNIVPMTISYQWEPCDFFKMRELYISRDGVKYVKEKDEDFVSILTGITQPKGNIHIAIGEPLQQEELQLLSKEKKPNDICKGVVTLIDQRIHNNYKLHNTNYIAHDLRSNTDTYATHYTPEEKEHFIQRCNRMLSQIDGDKKIAEQILLGIYANPV